MVHFTPFCCSLCRSDASLGGDARGRERGEQVSERGVFLLISNLGIATNMSVKYLFLLSSQGGGRGG